MGLFDPNADPNFNENHPPLLKDLGVVSVAEATLVYGDTKTYDAKFTNVYANNRQSLDLNQLHASGLLIDDIKPDASGNYALGGEVKVQRVWRLIDTPIVTAGSQTITFTEYYESSVSTLETFRALLSSTVEGGFLSVSASVTAEVEATISSEQSFIQGGSKSTETTVPGDTAIAAWELVEYMQISYNDSTLNLKLFGNIPLALPLTSITSCSVIVGEYNDLCPTSDLPQLVMSNE